MGKTKPQSKKQKRKKKSSSQGGQCGPCAPSTGYRYSVSSAQPVLVSVYSGVYIWVSIWRKSIYIYDKYITCYHIGSVVCICTQCIHICVCLCADMYSPLTYILCTHTHISFLYTHILYTHTFHSVASLGRKKMHYRREEEVERKTKMGQGLRTHGIIVPSKASGLMYSPL